MAEYFLLLAPYINNYRVCPLHPSICFEENFQNVMKVRLQEAMPEDPLHKIREQRELQENQGLELNDEQVNLNQEVESEGEQEQIHENYEMDFNDETNDSQSVNVEGAAADIEVQYDDENDVTFTTETNDTEIESRFSRFKGLTNKFKRQLFGLRRCKVNRLTDGTLDVTVHEEYNVQHGNDADSESDSEGDYSEGIPLVRFRHNDW